MARASARGGRGAHGWQSCHVAWPAASARETPVQAAGGAGRCWRWLARRAGKSALWVSFGEQKPVNSGEREGSSHEC